MASGGCAKTLTPVSNERTFCTSRRKGKKRRLQMAMNDRAFEREKQRRELTKVIEHIEEATTAELAGNMQEAEEKDTLAIIMLMPILMIDRDTLERGEGYIGQVFNTMKRERAHGS
jgi:hypothetical protein